MKTNYLNQIAKRYNAAVKAQRDFVGDVNRHDAAARDFSPIHVLDTPQDYFIIPNNSHMPVMRGYRRLPGQH